MQIKESIFIRFLDCSHWMWCAVSGISIRLCPNHFRIHFVISIWFYFLSETAMGIRINALSRPNSEYVKAVKEYVVYQCNNQLLLITFCSCSFFFRYPISCTALLMSFTCVCLILCFEINCFLNIRNCTQTKRMHCVCCIVSPTMSYANVEKSWSST